MKSSKHTKLFSEKLFNFRQVILVIGLATILSFSFSAFSQDNDFISIPDKYKVEGIPQIKKSDVEHLLFEPSEIKSNLIYDADSKNRRLLVTDETNHIYLLDNPLAKPSKLIGEIIPNTVKVRPDGKSFAFNSDHEDEDNYQIYLYDFSEKKSRKLISLKGKDESIDTFIWGEKGKILVFSRVDYETKKSRVCQYDFKTEKCFAADLNGIWTVLDSNRNKILLKYWKSSSNQQLYVLDTKTEKATPLDEEGNARRAFIIGDIVFWTSEGNPNCKKDPCVLTFNLKDGKIHQLELPTDLTDLNNISPSPNGKHVFLKGTVDGVDYLRVFELKKNKLGKELPSFIKGAHVIWNNRWMSDDEIVFTLENIGQPASIHSYNLNSRKMTDWTKAKLPRELEDKVSPAEVIKWKSFDGLEISGFIVRPKKIEKKSPVLIYVHGGPQVLDKPVFNSQEMSFIASLGLTIIHTNIRGSSGFGKEFMDADDKENRGDAVKDVQALLDWISNQSDLDREQIYLRGGSYGGFIVLATALQEPSRIKGVIAEYPLVSIKGLLTQDSVDDFVKNEYGDPEDKNLISMLEKLSPLNNTNRWNDIPLFLTRGKRDSRNPEKDVMDLKNQLQKKGSEVWFIYSNEDGHGFGGDYVTAAMYKFLKSQISKNRR